MNTEKPITRERPPFGLAFEIVPEKCGIDVVRTALQYRNRASGRVLGRLNGRLKRLKVPGFRDASRAMPGQLEMPVYDAILDGDDRLAGAVLRCWTDANERLRDLVAARLAEAEIELCTAYDAERFEGTWSHRDWDAQRAALLEAHDDLSREEVGLMLMALTGKYPILDDVDLPDVVTPRFRRWLDELDALPVTAAEWRDADEFVRAVHLLTDAKMIDLMMTILERRKTAVAEVVAKYADELAYLDIDLGPWSETDGRDPFTVADLAEDLAKALAEYRPVRQQAKSRAEETKRAAQRTSCEETILDIVARWEALSTDAFPLDDEPEDEVDLAGEVERLTKELGETRDELERLKAEHAKLREQHGQAEDSNEGLRLSREQRDAEASQLRGELSRSREAEEHWRTAYVEACKVRSAQDGAAPSIGNVRDAVTLAERAFGDELLFALNGKSDLSIPFGKPSEVFDALAWLATGYRRQPAATIGETCPGWFYKPDQTESTIGKFREWYETSVGGRTFPLLTHLGKGASFDPKSTIRIGFAWDDEQAKVVVGYVGRHQRTK